MRLGVLPPYELTNDEMEELDTATLPFQNTDDDGGGNNWRITTLISMINRRFVRYLLYVLPFLVGTALE
jgi:hypothetical protein